MSGSVSDFIFWHDASEISVEVLYLFARYRLKKDRKVLKRQQSTRKS